MHKPNVITNHMFSASTTLTPTQAPTHIPTKDPTTSFPTSTPSISPTRGPFYFYGPWETGPADLWLQAAGAQHIIWYDELYNNLRILDYWNHQSLYTYNLNSSNDNSIYNLTSVQDYYYPVRPGGFTHVVHGDYIYSLNFRKEMDVITASTLDINYNFTQVYSAPDRICIASVSLEHDYLILVGSLDYRQDSRCGEGFCYNGTQVYDITSNEWIFSGKPWVLDTAWWSYCIIVDQTIYDNIRWEEMH